MWPLAGGEGSSDLDAVLLPGDAGGGPEDKADHGPDLLGRDSGGSGLNNPFGDGACVAGKPLDAAGVIELVGPDQGILRCLKADVLTVAVLGLG